MPFLLLTINVLLEGRDVKKENMKRITLFIIVCLSSHFCFAQHEAEKARLRQQIAETEAEIARLQQQNSQKEGPKVYCYEKVVYNEVKPMSNEEFESFCKKEIPQVTSIPIAGNYEIFSSCRRTPQGVQANFCIATTPNVVNNTPIADNAAKEKELLKIRNTKKMYMNLIEALNKELESNGIEIVDQSANLAMKHIDIDGPTGEIIANNIGEWKKEELDKLRKKYNINASNIENENAQLIDDLANMGEKLLAIIPGGDKITNHYLWRIFKSTPELGKMIGHAGAMINIYFQIDEFQKKLSQLEEEEKRLLNK